MVHFGCHPPIDFPVYVQKFDPGNVISVTLTSTKARMLVVFVKVLWMIPLNLARIRRFE